MMRRLRRFLALSPARRRLFVGAWLALPVIDLMLRVLGLPRTQSILERSSALRLRAGKRSRRRARMPWSSPSPTVSRLTTAPACERNSGSGAGCRERPSPGFAIASPGLRWPRISTPSGEAIAAAEADAAVIAIAGRYALGNGTCLRQALFLWWRLRRRGHRPEIRIGVTLQDGFAAHAWVELGGRPLAQTPEQRGRFAPMEALTRGLPRRT